MSPGRAAPGKSTLCVVLFAKPLGSRQRDGQCTNKPDTRNGSLATLRDRASLITRWHEAAPHSSYLGHNVDCAHDELVDVAVSHQVVAFLRNRMLEAGPDLAAQLGRYGQVLAQVTQTDPGQVVYLERGNGTFKVWLKRKSSCDNERLARTFLKNRAREPLFFGFVGSTFSVGACVVSLMEPTVTAFPQPAARWRKHDDQGKA